MTGIEIALAIFAVLCAAAAFFFRMRERAAYRSLDKMLDAAIGGSFSEGEYDESRFSALECKLYRFLTLSHASARAVAEERRKIKELVSDISHQTKTPLSGILLYTQLLSEAELPENAQKLSREISSHAEKLGFLIDALVKTSRLETGIIAVRPEINSVSKLIREAVAALSAKAGENGVRLSSDCDEALSARFDPKWTEEALVNLLDNGVKYTEAGGHLTVTARPYELFCRIDVADTGCGIREEDIPRIFERFYRSPFAARKEGVGIGLYLARQILSAEGGYIKVQSVPGKGSVFSVFLPI